MGSTWNLKRLVPCLLWGSFVTSTFAQEGNFADYKQPDANHILFRKGNDNAGFGGSYLSAFGTASYSTPSGYYGTGNGISTWPADGNSANNGTAGFVISNLNSADRQPEFYDLNFLYNAPTGSPKRFRVDLFFNDNQGTTKLSIGTLANGGIIELAGTGTWLKAFSHRQQDLKLGSTYTAPTELRVVAIQDNNNNYPSFGTYSTSATLVVDNVRITVPKALSGMYKLSGGTSNDLGLFTFANSGVSVGTFTNWVQTIGNVDIVNVFGQQSVGYRGSSTEVLYSYVNSGVRQFSKSSFTQALTALLSSSWLGTGATGNPVTDRFYSTHVWSNGVNSGSLLRQITTSVYSHYIRNFYGNSSSNEISLDLGGEQIVAVTDINCDGFEDYITRLGTSLRYRLYQGYTLSGSTPSVTLSAPATLSTYGNLFCFASADVNNDGFNDLILQDTSTGDVFSLICNPSGGTLDWLFTLNSNEKLLAVADMDNDQIPDVYCKRDFSPTVGKLTIRKMAQDGLSVTTYDLLCEYANATYQPIAVGDINADGAADVVFGGNDSPNYSVYNALVNPSPNPLARNVLLGQYWICSAGTPTLRPIYYMGAN